MQQLALPDHGVKLKHGPDGAVLFDPVRRKWVQLTPEEWVRQHFINHLVTDLKCPLALLRVEHSISLNGLAKRADVVVHDRRGEPLALVETKAPDVKLGKAAFDQAARYNLVFKVAFLFVSNGMQHYCFKVDHLKNKVRAVEKMPTYAEMLAEVEG